MTKKSPKQDMLEARDQLVNDVNILEKEIKGKYKVIEQLNDTVLWINIEEQEQEVCDARALQKMLQP